MITSTFRNRLVQILLAVTLILLSNQTPAVAYSNNNMIDDGVFDDYNSMNETQIRNFILERPGTCLESQGLIFKEPKNYFDYGPELVDPARVIYIAAQFYEINPQVILSTLQKEQSLLTDVDCLDAGGNERLPKAMGYGCFEGPGAECPLPQYAGFSKQVMKGSWQLKFNKERAVGNISWEGDPGDQLLVYSGPFTKGYRQTNINNTPPVYYDGYWEIDGQQTYIETGGTASLYSYTPHLNQSFSDIFETYFGPTEGTPFFKVAGDNKTYMLGSENNYYHVNSYEMLTAYGLGKRFDYVSSKPSSYLSGRTFSGILGPVARFEGDEAYLVDRAGKYHFQTQAILEDTYGYTLGDEALLSAYLMYYYPDAGKMRNVIKEYGGDEIYVIEDGKRRRVPDIDAFRQGDPPYSTLPYVRLSSDYMKSLSASYPILGNNKLIKRYDTGSYGFWDGSLYYNIDRDTIVGLDLEPDYLMHSNEIANLTRAASPIAVLVKSSTPSYYVLDDRLKRIVPTSQLSNYGLTNTDFVPAPDNFLSRISNSSMSRIITVNHSGAKYLISGMARDQFDSARSIYEQGLSYSDILNITAHTGSAFPRSGKYLFATGTLFKISGQPQTYIINSSASKLYIDSNTIINEYNLDKSVTRSLSSQAVSRYPTVGDLSYITKDSTDNVWLVHSGGISQVIPSSQLVLSRLNINVSTTMKLSSYIYSQTTNRLAIKDILEDSSTGYIYYVENGLKRKLVSPGALGSLGYTEADISIVSPHFLESIPSGTDI